VATMNTRAAERPPRNACRAGMRTPRTRTPASVNPGSEGQDEIVDRNVEEIGAQRWVIREDGRCERERGRDPLDAISFEFSGFESEARACL
jgi:hypothetical protein